jgi:uncharacterized protein (UPF0261 family)
MTVLLEKAILQILELPESSQDALARWLINKLSSNSSELDFWIDEKVFDFWKHPDNDIWDTL